MVDRDFELDNGRDRLVCQWEILAFDDQLLLEQFAKRHFKLVSNLTGKDASSDQETFTALESWVLQSHALDQFLLQRADLLVSVDGDLLASASAHKAVISLFHLESGHSESRLPQVHHVVIHAAVDACEQL